MSLPDSTLVAIRLKVRRITKAPSSQQITDPQIDSYINTYYMIDFPEELRLKSLFTNYDFTTQANVDEYALPTGSSATGGADGFISVEPPIYIDGYQSFYSQSQSQFYTLYPKIAVTADLTTATGATNYTFTASAQTYNVPFLPGELVIFSQDSNGNTLSIHAEPQTAPVNDFVWNLVGDVDPLGTNTVNYVTGDIDLTWNSAPAVGESIQMQYVPYEPSRPLAVLFYNNNFILRPVPDAAYKVSIAAYKTPTSLMNSTDAPEIQQWWQLIAFGAALKIFEDRGDLKSRTEYYPLYDEQLRFALRRTLVQQTNERTATIYTEQTSFPYSNYFNRF